MPEDRDSLAQIYIGGGAPDFSACSRFFRIGDGEVLRAFLHRSAAGGEVPNTSVAEQTESTTVKKPKKTPLTLLLRDFLWNRRGWRKAVNAWIDEFSPDAVLLQAGDSPFMYRWAAEIADAKGIPLVVYNSEDYYFKKHDYTRSRGFAPLFYPLFRRMLRKEIRRAIARKLPFRSSS